MKKTLLSLLLGLLSTAMAQQNTFEFFSWDVPGNPYDRHKSPSDDSQNRTWTGSLDASRTNLILANNQDGDKIIAPLTFSAIDRSSLRLETNVFVDEFDAKIVFVNSAKIVAGTWRYADRYIIKVDPSNKVSFVSLGDLAQVDSTTEVANCASIGNRLVVTFYNGTIVWQGDPVSTLKGYYATTYFTDYKQTSYVLKGANEKGFFALHTDGTFQQLLSTEQVIRYDYDSLQGRLAVYTNVGGYRFQGKTQEALVIDSYQTIVGVTDYSQTAKAFSKSGFAAEMIASSKGFNITEGSQSHTYLFADKLDGIASLRYDYADIQEDSTIMLFYHNNSTDFVKEIFVFTYKNGIVQLYKKMDVFSHKLIYPRIAGILDNGHLLLYACDNRNALYQFVDDKVTVIPLTNSSCSIYIYELAIDKKYIWLKNYFEQSSPCALTRMAHDSYFVRGRVFYDANSNGIKETSELWYGKLTLKAKPSGLLLFPDIEGHYAFKGEAGVQYLVGLLDSSLYSSIKTEASTGYIGVRLKDEKPEVSTSFWLPTSRCGTNRSASFSLHNTGVVPVQKVVVKLIPQGLQLLQDNVLVDTAVFEHSNVAVGQFTNLSYNIQWPTPDVVGQTATLKTITELYVGNVLISSKLDSVQTVIRCSYDPNDKSVTPVGLGDEAFVLNKNTLKYLIRFENTGNDTAYNIVVKDTLSNQLDWTTFKLIGASHLVNTELSPEGVLSFHFNNIMLPDTGKGKEAAQGYVRFAISPRSDVSDYTKLCNRAAIYFDGNKPVITNDACNTLVEKMPSITKTGEQLLSASGMLYPNPAQDWVKLANDTQTAILYNSLGEEILQSVGGKMSLVGVPNGVYLVRIAHKDGTLTTEKLSVLR